MSKLAELVRFGEKTTLIERSGIQFMDFGLDLQDLRKEPPGEFALQASERSLARLEYDERRDRLVHPADPNVSVSSTLSVPVDESFKLLQGCWLPLPYLYTGQDRVGADKNGPTTWARGRIVELEPGDDLQGNTHRLTLAFDTNLYESSEGTDYLTPTRAEIEGGGASFELAHRAHEVGWFLELPWIEGWLDEVFREQAAVRLRLVDEDIDEEAAKRAHQAHYLNLLAVVGGQLDPPEIVLRLNARQEIRDPIPVDLVLDVGNSRTCGILIEEHPQQDHGLKNRYELALRDLTHPERVYAEPFESRVEFAQAVLGKEQWACRSGRNDAFVWPTIARVGPEAARLANHRRGIEGSTGLSSPKRYLWDESAYAPGWRFNVSHDRSEVEPHATGAPFSQLIDSEGIPLWGRDDATPVFMPHYSRSAMMTFMLAEVLTQALGQINSPTQRLKQGDPDKPRHLRSIILTVPPSMPKPERDLFIERMDQAKGLVWKALGWHPEADTLAEEESAWPPFPSVHTQWDEATCAQVVYVFSETHEHFGGRPEDFFQAIRRKGKAQDDRRITIASIDIGGGTTDLVVSDYRLDAGQGANVYILPEQRFRDGFKVAGDDLLLEVVRETVVEALADALRAHGIAEPNPLLSKLVGAESGSVQEQALRQQLALQILYPLGIEILGQYEQFDPVAGAAPHTRSIREILEEREPASKEVIEYFASGVRREGPQGAPDFDILDVPLTIDLQAVHELFVADQLEICKTIRALCEMVHLYDCDVLLLSGRPSRLPGVQALFRSFLPLPPDRVVPLAGFRTGTWYPFHKDGRIDDPKTTAAVGAMICKVGGERRIPNFNFRAGVFRSYSTVRHIGVMDRNMIIKNEDVYYSDVELDDPDYELPDHAFEVRGRMVLGFRQLASPRWGASPLYVIDLSDRAKKSLDSAADTDVATLKVSLKRSKQGERFEIDNIVSETGGLRKGEVVIELNTLQTIGMGETSYWLDSGSVYR